MFKRLRLSIKPILGNSDRWPKMVPSSFGAVLLLTAVSFAQSKSLTLQALYVEDQRDRGIALADDGISLLPREQAEKLPSYNWQKEVPKRDEIRRKYARSLLAKPGLTGEDCFYAAYLFQHGLNADDYLFAHILATEAIALGYSRAKWISAATLDRYLQQIGQKQVFGTQYNGQQLAYYLEHQHEQNAVDKIKRLTDKQTLEPYASQIVPDSVRAEFCVPPLGAQNQHIADVEAGKTKPELLPRLKDCIR